MSDELIRRDDALEAAHEADSLEMATHGATKIAERIAALPAVTLVPLDLTDGRSVVWGTTDRTAEKAEKLAALLTQPGRVYDVSTPDLPTVK